MYNSLGFLIIAIAPPYITWRFMGVISRVTIIKTHIRGLLTILITTHEPPSTACGRLRLKDCLIRFPLVLVRVALRDLLCSGFSKKTDYQA